MTNRGLPEQKIQCAAGRQDQKVRKKTLTRIFRQYASDQEACIRREEDYKRTALECNLRRLPVKREQEDSGNAH